MIIPKRPRYLDKTHRVKVISDTKLEIQVTGVNAPEQVKVVERN